MSERGEPKKAYAVSSGAYSDYGVDAIFDTHERAEEFLRAKGLVLQPVSDHHPSVTDPPKYWAKPDAESVSYFDYYIEEFDYYDGDVLPLSDNPSDSENSPAA